MKLNGILATKKPTLHKKLLNVLAQPKKERNLYMNQGKQGCAKIERDFDHFKQDYRF